MAVDIASKTYGTVTVLHVIYLPAMYNPNFTGDAIDFNPGLLISLEDDAKKAFEVMKKEYGRGIKMDLQLVCGEIIGSIKRISEEKKIDLVVMGTSGASGLQETLIGSNTEKVVRFSEIPVLTVREARDINSIRNILLPTTGLLDQTDFMANVKQLQDILKATLHILLINTPANFRSDAAGREMLEEFVKHYHLKDYQLHFKNYRSEEEGIIDFTSSTPVDMIVMATHARRGLAHLFSGSVTEDVVNHIQNTPVWTYSIRK